MWHCNRFKRPLYLIGVFVVAVYISWCSSLVVCCVFERVLRSPEQEILELAWERRVDAVKRANDVSVSSVFVNM